MEDTSALATGGGSDHSPKMGNSPYTLPRLRLSRQDGDSITSTSVGEQPYSPTSPTSCILPDGCSRLMIRDGYELPSPPPINQEDAHTSRATDASFLPNLDAEPFSCDDDLEYGDMFPPRCIADPCVVLRQAISFAEASLKLHNDDPSNEVKYELVEAIESNFIFHGGCYGHVNFIARAKGEEGSQQELFFAELNLRGPDFTTLTCFRSLKEKDDQVGGRLGSQREDDDGIDDLDHCYACTDVLKHPRDGASYHAGHWTGRRCYEYP